MPDFIYWELLVFRPAQVPPPHDEAPHREPLVRNEAVGTLKERLPWAVERLPVPLKKSDVP